jgi:hypothetical protein
MQSHGILESQDEYFKLNSFIRLMDSIAYFTSTYICIENGILLKTELNPPPRWYPYFDVVVGFVWSNNPARYAGGSVATGMASHAGQVKGDDPAKKG